MIPDDWIEHRRGDGELVGWIVPDGTVGPVRIAEASARGIVVLADEYGATSGVGAKPERFELPFPAPDALRRHEGR